MSTDSSLPIFPTPTFPCQAPTSTMAVAPVTGSTFAEPSPALALRTGEEHDPDFTDLVDEWGRQSFPASDPPANW